MSRFFSTDSKFYAAMSLATDLVIINLLLLATSLPFVTVGASLRAATVVIRQLLNDEGSTPVRTYLREFRIHWRAPTLWWLISAGLWGLAIYEFYVFNMAAGAGLGGASRVALYASVMSGLGIITAISVWFYPLARGEGFMPTLKTAVLEMFSAPLRTAAATVIALSPWLALMLGSTQPGMLITFYGIIGWAFTQYLVMLVLDVEIRRGIGDENEPASGDF